MVKYEEGGMLEELSHKWDKQALIKILEIWFAWLYEKAPSKCMFTLGILTVY